MDLIQKACNLGFILKNKEYYLWEIQKWLREAHNIHLVIECFNDEEPNYHATIYAKALWRDNEFGDATYTHFTSYEEVLEAGLQEALKLI